MLPEHFYFTSAGWLGYILYMPFGLLAAWIVYRYALRRIPLSPVRWLITPIVSVSLLTLPLWEALAISHEAERLCKEQGGLHVYKTVETDGFLGSSDANFWGKYGFKYVEHGQYYKDGIFTGIKYRYLIEDGKKKKNIVNNFISSYQLQRYSKNNDNNFRTTRYWISDRINNHIISELIYFSIYPSLFDTFFLRMLPVEFNPWICGNEASEGKGVYNRGKKKYLYSSIDLVKATLKPIKRREGEAQ